jgi:hypothetical protein
MIKINIKWNRQDYKKTTQMQEWLKETTNKEVYTLLYLMIKQV